MVLKSPGRIIILSGPSGAGKTTLHEMLLKNRRWKRRLVRSLSATTRAPRPGERNGRDYWFLTRKEFLAKKKRGEFLESMKVFANDYGTPLDKVQQALNRGRHVLLCIDVKGAKLVGRKRKDSLKIFIKTPTLSDLKQRLMKRGTEDPADLKLRLAIAQNELKEAKYYDHVIVNDDLTRAFRELQDVLARELGSA